MSANLLAELDSFYGPISSTAETSKAAVQHTPTQRADKQSHDENDDDFGDFEGPEAPSQQAACLAQRTPNAAKAPMEYDSWADMQWSAVQSSQGHRPEPIRVNSLAILGNSRSRNVAHGGFDMTPHRQPAQRPPKPRDDNVLFDASEDEDGSDSDFGDFEGSAAKTEVKPSPQQEFTPRVTLNPIEERQIWVPEKRKPPPNLLDLDADENKLEYHMSSIQLNGAASSTSFPVACSTKPATSKPEGKQAYRSYDSHPMLNASTVKESPSQPPKAFSSPRDEKSQADGFDAWDDFEDSTSYAGTTTSHQPVVSENASPPLPRLLQQISVTGAIPPTNIPPPVVLFTLFPPIFRAALSDFLEPFTHAVSDVNERNQIAQTPAVMQYLQDYISIATTCAHIIGGRKLRWKRDTILSQSMRIGPASASGKSGGMKLTGIDKSENAKEEREAADVVAAWKRQMGKLRTATTGVQGVPRVPEISDTMPVRMASPSEGALLSPKQCILCGLKRNERVNKVDLDVQDSFGEWWIEHWGHYACMSFWETNKVKLAGR